MLIIPVIFLKEHGKDLFLKEMKWKIPKIKKINNKWEDLGKLLPKEKINKVALILFGFLRKALINKKKRKKVKKEAASKMLKFNSRMKIKYNKPT